MQTIVITVINADVLKALKSLPDGCVQTVITSPPYYLLRNYHVEGQLGLEKTPAEYIQNLVIVFRELKRVLRDDGTCWCNMGDSYAGSGRGPTGKTGIQNAEKRQGFTNNEDPAGKRRNHTDAPAGFKAKDLMGMPWALAFALRDDGWYLRTDIVWEKPNPMPESVKDRPTRSHEFIFLLTKSQKYFYDAEAIREPVSGGTHARGNYKGDLPKTAAPGKGIKQNSSFVKATWGQPPKPNKQDTLGKATYTGFNKRWKERKNYDNLCSGICGTARTHSGNSMGNFAPTRNKRDVWKIATQSRPEAHFASFPDELARICIKAGTSEYGCCPACGAPYARVLKKVASTMNIRVRDNVKGIIDQKSGLGSRYKASEEEIAEYSYEKNAKCEGEAAGFTETIGWRPTCSCQAGDPVPCVTLDPFMGRGTVALVSRSLGRSSIGIELNPEYVEISRLNLMKGQSALDTGVVRYDFKVIP